MSVISLLIAALFVFGFGIGIYMLFPAIKGKIKSHGACEQMKLDQADTKAKTQPSHKRSQKRATKVHKEIIGKAKTVVSDYVYTSDDESDSVDEETEYQTPEQLMAQGITASDLEDEMDKELWEVPESLSANFQSPADFNNVARGVLRNDLSEQAQQDFIESAEKLKNTGYITKLDDFLAQLPSIEQNMNAEYNRIIQKGLIKEFT